MSDERESIDLSHLPALLEQAQAEPDWKRRLECIRPFISAMVDAKLWLAERDVLLRRAAEVFGCSESSLLIDCRRCRLEMAQNEEREEIANLERWFQA